MAHRKLVPYAVLKQAVSGDPIAMDKVVAYYQGYIRTLASKNYVDGWGVSRTFCNEDICAELQAHLVRKVLAFDLDRP